MNITELIVELLQQGQKVEVPGIGTFDSTVQEPRHDATTRIYYPATRRVVLYEDVSGDNSIVDLIAARECVAPEVAQQMWANYTDALTEKMERTGEHLFGELGTLTLANGTYAFKAAEDVVIGTGETATAPLAEVKTYDHDNDDDPFAQFDPEPTQVSTQPKPAPKPQPEPEPQPQPIVAAVPAKELEKAKKEAEKEALKAKKEAEEKAIKAKKEAKEKAIKAKKETEEKAHKAKKEAEKQAKEAEKEVARQAKAAEIEAARLAKESEIESARQAKEAKKQAKKEAKRKKKEEREKKKRRKGWLWLLLLLLLIGAGIAYYFLKVNSRCAATSEYIAGKPMNASNINSLTFNTDMLDYSHREISQNCDRVSRAMSDYVDAFLAEHGYSEARVPMMDHIRQYADQRLHQLQDPRFAVQRFIPYDDYVYRASEPWLRAHYAGKARGTVQGELMDGGYLAKALEQVVSEYGLASTPTPTPATEPAQPAIPAQKAAEPKTQPVPVESPAFVYVEKNSKQGFDIIAGFYVNRSTAAKVASRLHEQGCDAYIIEKDDMYYVSMGSAPTRTKAEALYKHIKSWYDGDIVIKEL